MNSVVAHEKGCGIARCDVEGKAECGTELKCGDENEGEYPHSNLPGGE